MAYRTLSRVAEDAGFGLLMTSHRYSTQPAKTLAPWPLLGAVTAWTRLEVAVGVLVASLVHPLEIANEVASLSCLSGGRAILGVGSGYRRDEFAAFGVPFEGRFERTEQVVRYLRAFWAGEHAPDLMFGDPADAPRGVLPPPGGEPPIWYGAMTEAAVIRAARLGCSWLVPSTMPMGQVRDLRDVHRRELPDGVDRDRLRFPVRRDVLLSTDPAECEAMLERYSSFSDRGAPNATESSASPLIAGDPAACTEGLSAVVDDLGSDPEVIIGIEAPGMELRDLLAAVEVLGGEVLPRVGR